eukprot:10859812-Heterocapsa_arctica.AAC.1
MKLGDDWFRVDGTRRRAHRPLGGLLNKSMKTRSLAQKRTGAKGATHRCEKDTRRSNGGLHFTGSKSDRTSKRDSGADKCGTQHSRNG